MNEETTKLISQLAEKLGTTTEYLWSVLIKQAPIDASVTLFQTLLLIPAWIVLWKTHKHLSKPKSDAKYAYNGYDDNRGAHVFLMIFSASTVFIFSIASFCSIGDIINGYFNPEYWALNNILSKCN